MVEEADGTGERGSASFHSHPAHHAPGALRPSRSRRRPQESNKAASAKEGRGGGAEAERLRGVLRWCCPAAPCPARVPRPPPRSRRGPPR
jgi:hypothetical protein